MLNNNGSLFVVYANFFLIVSIEMLKYEMEQMYYTEMDKLKHENEMEMMTIRVELERAIEIGKQKERESEIKTEEYQSEMRLKQKHIDKLSEEIKDLKLVNSTLKEEIDLKSREIKQIRSEVLAELKNKEAIMQQKKEEEMNRLNAEHMKQKQVLVNEFKQAQEILKEKILETEQS